MQNMKHLKTQKNVKQKSLFVTQSPKDSHTTILCRMLNIFSFFQTRVCHLVYGFKACFAFPYPVNFFSILTNILLQLDFCDYIAFHCILPFLGFEYSDCFQFLSLLLVLCWVPSYHHPFSHLQLFLFFNSFHCLLVCFTFWHARSQFSDQDSNPRTLQWKWRIFTIGLLRESLYFFIMNSFNFWDKEQVHFQFFTVFLVIYI